MVTAESKTENVIAAKKAGVDNYIVKPFNAETLKSKIEAVFEDAPITARRDVPAVAAPPTAPDAAPAPAPAAASAPAPAS
jgi:DNA-binding response OmpR family regulator